MLQAVSTILEHNQVPNTTNSNISVAAMVESWGHKTVDQTQTSQTLKINVYCPVHVRHCLTHCTRHWGIPIKKNKALCLP